MGNRIEFINDKEFWLLNDKGKRIQYDVVFSFLNEDNNKNYIVFTNNSRDKSGCINVWAAIYDPRNKLPELKPIEGYREWKVIETILEEIQNEVTEKRFVLEKTNVDVRGDDSGNDSVDPKGEKVDFDVTSLIDSVKEQIQLSKHIGFNEQTLKQFAENLQKEKDPNTIEKMFNELKENNVLEHSFYFSLAMSSYGEKNYSVSERAFRLAVEYGVGSKEEIMYKNNLAYVIRRKEVANPENVSKTEVPILLRSGVIQKDTFSLINMALFWVGEDEWKGKWKLVDSLIANIEDLALYNISNARDWWETVAREGDEEGYLVHLLLLHRRKIVKSSLGTISELYDIVKKRYPGIPKKFSTIFF